MSRKSPRVKAREPYTPGSGVLDDLPSFDTESMITKLVAVGECPCSGPPSSLSPQSCLVQKSCGTCLAEYLCNATCDLYIGPPFSKSSPPSFFPQVPPHVLGSRFRWGIRDSSTFLGNWSRLESRVAGVKEWVWSKQAPGRVMCARHACSFVYETYHVLCGGAGEYHEFLLLE